MTPDEKVKDYLERAKDLQLCLPGRLYSGNEIIPDNTYHDWAMQRLELAKMIQLEELKSSSFH